MKAITAVFSQYFNSSKFIYITKEETSIAWLSQSRLDKFGDAIILILNKYTRSYYKKSEWYLTLCIEVLGIRTVDLCGSYST